MIERFCEYESDHEPFLRTRGHEGRHVAENHAALTVFLTPPRRCNQSGTLNFDEAEAHVIVHRLQHRLAFKLSEPRRRNKQVHLRRRSLL